MRNKLLSFLIYTTTIFSKLLSLFTFGKKENLSFNSWKRIAIIFILVLFIDSTTEIQNMVNSFYHNKYEPRRESYEQALFLKDRQIERMRENEEEYRNTISNITRLVRQTESFLNVGGSIGYDEEGNFERIIESEQSFGKYLENAENFFQQRTSYIQSLPDIWPLAKSPLNRVTSPFGERINPMTGSVSQHNGIDLAGRWEAQVIATADGVIEQRWIMHPEFGRLIVIDHENGIKTVYAHLAQTFVHQTQGVEKGQPIGLMGNSGSRSVGAHLHYEIRKNGEPLNPINFLRGQMDNAN